MEIKISDLNVGDLVQIRAESIIYPTIRATVISIKNGKIRFLSPFLTPFKLKDTYDVGEVKILERYGEAGIAIPEHTLEKCFKKKQIVKLLDKNIIRFGLIIAAIEGWVAVKTIQGVMCEEVERFEAI